MTWFAAREIGESDYSAVNAGGKARVDVEVILEHRGLCPLTVRSAKNREHATRFAKLKSHATMRQRWLDAANQLGKNDVLVMQFPADGHTIFFGDVVKRVHKRGAWLVLLIHDLDGLRIAISEGTNTAMSRRIELEETAAVKGADALIVHNEDMARAVEATYNVPRDRLVSLGLFDYLTTDQSVGDGNETRSRFSLGGDVVVAGNLSREKAGYVYRLPVDVPFTLYGGNYTGEPRDNVRYAGTVPADELPSRLRGSFGLVWDGPEACTCAGAYGAYLRINNPHKLSLYLAAGMPVVVWSEAAVAQVVRDEGVGVVVDDLGDLGRALRGVSAEQYELMAGNAERVGRLLRSGTYTTAALETVRSLLQN